MNGLFTMSNQELRRVSILEKVLDGRMTQVQAAKELNLSTRQISRLRTHFQKDGVAGLQSKKRNQRSNRALPEHYKEFILGIIRENYQDFGPTLVAEKLLERHDISISKETLRHWMIAARIWKTRKQRRDRPHQPRNRRDCYGELIQIDGSDHHWFEERGPRCTLLVYVDDATSSLMELRFAPSESTFDYFHSTKRYIQRHGKPVAFYSDKHSIFRVSDKKVSQGGGTGMTQFGRALDQLNIEIICANTSQAKGRVERMNKTLQDRLVKELRLRKISNMTDGNEFLEEYMEEFNAKFSKPARIGKDLHRPLTSFENIDDIFSVQIQRTVTKNLTFQYDRVMYLIYPNDFTKGLVGKRIDILDFPDGSIDIRYEGNSIPYNPFFDKAQKIKQAEIVENKRLGAVLEWAKQKQEEIGIKRSQSAHTRRGQKQILEEKQRKLNPATLSA